MAVILYLFRHGIAEEGLGIDDAGRQLTDEGRRKVGQIAAGLQAVGVIPDLVLASPLVRAQQTAQIAAGILAPDLEVVTFAPLALGGEPLDLLAELAPYRGSRDIFLVGHEPSLGELASQLLTGTAHVAPLPFKKGSIAAIEVYSIPPRSPGILHWFMPPRMLRALN